MLIFICLVLLCVVAVPGGLNHALDSLDWVVKHIHHRYHTTNILHNVVLGSHWLITSLYSIIPSLGEPSQSLVNSHCIIGNMPDPPVAEEEGARAFNI